MSRANRQLIEALRSAAQRIKDEAVKYAWGHHGSCNCGHLVQSVTSWTPSEIIRFAHTGSGEWSEMAEAWCPHSNAPVDYLVRQLIDLGLTPTDIANLERLNDREVLRSLPGGFRHLRHNRREDAALYMETLANMLEERLSDQILRKALHSVSAEPVGIEA